MLGRLLEHRVKSCILTKLGHQATSIESISYNLMRSGPEPSAYKPSLSESFLSEITFTENHPVWGMISLLLLRWFFDLDIGLTRSLYKTHNIWLLIDYGEKLVKCKNEVVEETVIVLVLGLGLRANIQKRLSD